MRVFSFGGGVQSTAALVLAAQGKIDYQTFMFADTGDEHPETYEYLEEVHKPFAEEHGLEILCLKRTWRDGSQYSILEHIDRLESAISIPVYLDSGKPWQRQCTVDWKINTIAKELKRRGATAENPAQVGMGISVDEVHRAKSSSVPHEDLQFPLLDLMLRRDDCERITREAGLPRAPRSACFYCPYHSTEYWRDLREEQPALFERAIQLEDTLTARTEKKFGTSVRLWRKGPLRTLDDQQRFDLDEPDTCDSGHCFT